MQSSKTSSSAKGKGKGYEQSEHWKEKDYYGTSSSSKTSKGSKSSKGDHIPTVHPSLCGEDPLPVHKKVPLNSKTSKRPPKLKAPKHYPSKSNGKGNGAIKSKKSAKISKSAKSYSEGKGKGGAVYPPAPSRMSSKNRDKISEAPSPSKSLKSYSSKAFGKAVVLPAPGVPHDPVPTSPMSPPPAASTTDEPTSEPSASKPALRPSAPPYGTTMNGTRVGVFRP